MSNPICQIHQTEMKYIPAGVSKRTGKPYNAFWGCTDPDCKQTIRTQNSPTLSTTRAQAPSTRDVSIERQVAFKGAIELAAAGKIGIADIRANVEAFVNIIRGVKPEPTVYRDPIGEDVPPPEEMGGHVEENNISAGDIPF